MLSGSQTSAIDDDARTTNQLTTLFNSFVAGNRSSFEKFYHAIKRSLMSYCIALMGNEDDAKDLFHTTMLKVYESSTTFRGDNVCAWIFTIARNGARSHSRKASRLEPLSGEFDIAQDQPPQIDDDEKLRMQRAIRNLRPEYQAVIYMRYYGEMSVADIAAAESISIELVKVRLHRARHELASALRTTFKDTP